MNTDYVWQDLLGKCLRQGELRKSRVGAAWSLFGESFTVNNMTAFPAVTTKRLAFKQVAAEMSAFIAGAASLEEMRAHGCRIWDKNAEARDGVLGPIYGAQWRNWRGVDQLLALYEGLRKDPLSRRHLVSAWNVDELEDMCLPPCPFAFQVSVRDGGYLDMVVYQRSCDAFLGLPFDIAGYALLQRLVCKSTGYASGRLAFMLGDVHVYENHVEQAQTVMERFPRQAPTLVLSEEASMFRMRAEWAKLEGYEPHDAVSAELNA